MTKVALYVRDAAREQNGMGFNEQFHACRDYAVEKHWDIVNTYHDVASGNLDASKRPGLLALLEDAEQHEFDAILVKDLDRFSRNLVNLAALLKKLRSFGIRVLTVDDGEFDFAQPRLDPARTLIIRRVFKEFAYGGSSRTIEKRLNDFGVPPPCWRR